MDKGAHFHKSDFQVHTPRDATWKGAGAVTPQERKAYAEELIHACRIKSLDAIAITDHHDLAFFQYIRRAAQDELDDSGQPIPVDKKIIVFPGIELTLTAPACQVILLLDANFPETLLQSVLTALAISPAPLADAKHATVQRVPQNVIHDLSDLYEKLNSHDHLKGKFIVLPNVSETGHGTMLRTGFGNFYKTMPCVGGYTDGPIAKFGQGNLAIIQGANRDYGFKAIGVFQTSDNRKRDHSDLGTHITYVKWSEPTAEALRQACLARKSRLSLVEPELPRLWITSVSVSNSKFLGRLNLDLNQQYNAIIGGRGTGKSTILEYLRWGLCDQAIESEDIDIVQNKRKNLIDNTLQKFEGEVHVEVMLNDVLHIVKRNSKKQEIVLKIGNGDFAPATEENVRNLFPIQAYSQKQLSSVGVKISELKRFIELPIKQKLDQIRSQVRAIDAKLRSTYGDLIRIKEVEVEVEKNKVELASSTEQLSKLRKGLKGLSTEDQNTINLKVRYDNEETIIENLKNELNTAKEHVKTLVGALKREEQEQNKEDIEFENTTLISSIHDKFVSKFAEIEAQATAISNLFQPTSLKTIDDEIKEWEKLKATFDKQYESAKSKAQVNQQQLVQIQTLERRIALLKKQQTEKRNAITALGDPVSAYTILRATWGTLHRQKLDALDNQCTGFTVLSNKLIKAELANSLDTDTLTQMLKTAFVGMNIREDKIWNICQCLLKAVDPLAEWNDILAELEKLAQHSTDGPEKMPDTPLLVDRCNFLDSERTRIATQFNSTLWLNLSVAELEFNPRFLYCTNPVKEDYIEFADASAGQQATALLTVLLNQSGAPLIIDQPEDDIDSKMVKDIIQQLWMAKSKRQLVFASHSANFVVNGDAELVVCCDYVKAGDQTHGAIKAVGAIDNADVREEITLVTEGGKEVFQLRMEKYGY